MPDDREKLARLIRGAGLTRAQAAELLGVSLWTLHAWLKPKTSTSANPVPQWALELLAYKIRDPNPPFPLDFS